MRVIRYQTEVICIGPNIHDHAFATLQSLQPVKALSQHLNFPRQAGSALASGAQLLIPYPLQKAVDQSIPPNVLPATAAGDRKTVRDAFVKLPDSTTATKVRNKSILSSDNLDLFAFIITLFHLIRLINLC